MKFYIQTSNPSIQNNFDSRATTLDEYIESVFDLNTENVIMNFSDTYIPLNYKYTISSIMNDVLHMLKKLINHKKGDIVINWSSSDFLSTWELKWAKSQLEINTKWLSVIGNTENILNQSPKIKIEVESFLSEWKKLLEVVYLGLTQSNYFPEDFKEVKKIKELIERIPNYGVLYNS